MVYVYEQDNSLKWLILREAFYFSHKWLMTSRNFFCERDTTTVVVCLFRLVSYSFSSIVFRRLEQEKKLLHFLVVQTGVKTLENNMISIMLGFLFILG